MNNEINTADIGQKEQTTLPSSPLSEPKSNKEPEKTKGLSAGMIKLVAIIAMCLDHYAWHYLSLYEACGQIIHAVGRITMPIMCYFLAVGFVKTKNFTKYALRLFLFALISQIPFSVYFDGGINLSHLNVLFTLFLALMALYVIRLDKLHPIIKGLALLIVFYLSEMCDWGMWCIIMCMCFYMFVIPNNQTKKKNKSLILTISVIAVTYTMLNLYGLMGYGFNVAAINSFYRLGIMLCIPLLCAYNGERGKDVLGMSKWFFYLFYPVHLIILYLTTLI